MIKKRLDHSDSSDLGNHLPWKEDTFPGESVDENVDKNTVFTVNSPSKDKDGGEYYPHDLVEALDAQNPEVTRKELIELIETLPEGGLLRPVYNLAVLLRENPSLAAPMGKELLKANPPKARWVDRDKTEDANLDAADFIQKHYGQFLDGTVTRRDIEDMDARLIRAFRDLPQDRQATLKLPVGRGANEATQLRVVERITTGTHGPISFDRLWSLTKAVYSRRQRNAPL